MPPDEDARWASAEYEELQQLLDPELEFIQPEVQIDAAEFHGRRAFFDVWNDWLNLWQRHRSRITRVEERGGRILVLSHESYLGRDGLALERDAGGIWTVEDGRAVRFDAFLDEQTALAAWNSASAER